MDFSTVLQILIGEFIKHRLRYGLIGGFALYFYDIPRTTADLDFLIEKEDLPRLDIIMARHGYKLAYRSDNVSQFVNTDINFGEIDIIHAFRDYARAMIDEAETISKENIKIKVVKPEGIIGLKVQAIANDETRRNRELADIEAMLAKFSDDIDWPMLEKYFMIFGMKNDFVSFKKRYAKR